MSVCVCMRPSGGVTSGGPCMYVCMRLYDIIAHVMSSCIPVYGHGEACRGASEQHGYQSSGASRAAGPAEQQGQQSRRGSRTALQQGSRRAAEQQRQHSSRRQQREQSSRGSRVSRTAWASEQQGSREHQSSRGSRAGEAAGKRQQSSRAMDDGTL